MDKTRSKRSYCRFCLSFCGMIIYFNDQGKPTKVLGDSDHPVSKGYTCKKGRNLLEFYSRGRLLHPMRFGKETLSWETALSDLGQTIKTVVECYGPDAIALYAGTNATLDAAGMWTALGFMYRLTSKNLYTVASIDAINKQVVIENLTSCGTTGLIPQVDFDKTDCLLLIGSNPVVSHGHLAGIPYPDKRLRDIVKRCGNVIVADPRVTETSKRATLHIRPRPGSDYAWLAFVIRELLADPAGYGVDHNYIHAHTTGVAELKSLTTYFNAERTTQVTGLDSETLYALLEIIRTSVNFSAITGTGVSFNDTGIVTEWFLWALLAIKGKLDRAGGVWFNAGVVEKNTSFREALPLSDRKSAWLMGMPARPNLRAKRGERPVAGIADEILAGNIKVLICLGGNPINAFPNRSKTLNALANLDALVVLDTHKNDLIGLAHYGLPVCGQLERADSSIYAQNSAPIRSVLYTDKVLEPTGQAKPAWWVFSKLGEELGFDTVKLGKKTEQLDDLDVLKTIKESKNCFAETSLIVTGHIISEEGQQFGWVRNTLLADKKWNLTTPALVAELQRVLSQPLERRPLLISMREASQLNSQFVVGKTEELAPAYIHSSDARKYGIVNDEVVQLSSANGTMRVKITISDNAAVNTIGVPHGYGQFGNVSCLTSEVDGINPLSAMVRQTSIPITLEKIVGN